MEYPCAINVISALVKVLSDNEFRKPVLRGDK